MIELTKEQRQELCLAEPVVLDPETLRRYVLVPRVAYDSDRRLHGANGEAFKVVEISFEG